MSRTLTLVCMLGMMATASCGDDDDPFDADARVNDDVDANVSDCFENPTTHEEIINACTDAQKIEKNPVLPLLNDDGSLPDLPE